MATTSTHDEIISRAIQKGILTMQMSAHPESSAKHCELPLAMTRELLSRESDAQKAETVRILEAHGEC